MKRDRYLELDFTDTPTDLRMDRRELLKLAGGGILILFTVGDSLLEAQERRGGRSGQRLPEDFNAFLRTLVNAQVLKHGLPQRARLCFHHVLYSTGKLWGQPYGVFVSRWHFCKRRLIYPLCRRHHPEMLS